MIYRAVTVCCAEVYRGRFLAGPVSVLNIVTSDRSENEKPSTCGSCGRDAGHSATGHRGSRHAIITGEGGIVIPTGHLAGDRPTAEDIDDTGVGTGSPLLSRHVALTLRSLVNDPHFRLRHPAATPRPRSIQVREQPGLLILVEDHLPAMSLDDPGLSSMAGDDAAMLERLHA